MRTFDAAIPVAGAVLSGTLALPDSDRAPGVLLIGGTFSDLRDGDADPRHRPDIPPHGMYRHLSDALVEAGFAVLRFDRRGCGASSGTRPDRATEIADALAAWQWLGARPDADAAAMVGESAGAYVLCRMMAAGAAPVSVVLQGALCRSITGLIAFNATRARAFWSRGDAERLWMWQHARREYESAVIGLAMVTALENGQGSVAVDDERGVVVRQLDELEYDVRYPPGEQFRHVTCSAFVVHGADDLNVPVEDAFDTVRALWQAGNRDIELCVLPHADHSFQATSDDSDQQLRDRMSMQSFRRPFHQRYPEVIVNYLGRTVRPAST